jgi:hypothetical protein
MSVMEGILCGQEDIWRRERDVPPGFVRLSLLSCQVRLRLSCQKRGERAGAVTLQAKKGPGDICHFQVCAGTDQSMQTESIEKIVRMMMFD